MAIGESFNNSPILKSPNFIHKHLDTPIIKGHAQSPIKHIVAALSHTPWRYTNTFEKRVKEHKKQLDSKKTPKKKPLPSMVSSLSKEELEQVNETVASKTKEVQAPTSGRKRSQYNDYSAEERAKIGKYAAENGATKACRHFSKTLGRSIPEATARRLKSQYLATLNSKIQISGESSQSIDPSVQFLPKKNPGRPLLLGKFLDDSVREFIESLRKVGGVVNTAIVQAAAEGIVAAKKPLFLVKHGGHITITKGWVKSLFSRMGYVKRKGSNAGKITVTQFDEVQVLADIKG